MYPTVASPGLTRSAAPADHRFFGWLAVTAAAVVLAGFSTSYYLWPLTQATRSASGRPLDGSFPLIVHLHAGLFTAWMAILVTQTRLVAVHRTDVHRRVGRLAGWLAPAMAVTGVLAAVQGVRDDWNPGGPYRDAVAFFVVGLADLLVFTTCTMAGLWYRARPELHKRLMLLGTLGGLMWPAITRMPVISGKPSLMFGLMASLVLAPAVRDAWRRLSTWRLSLAIGVAILASFPLRTAVGNSEPWHQLVAWLLG